MYYFSWIVLVVISLWVSVVGFIWALKGGQFSDQSRARYLPLRDDFPLPPVKNPAKFSFEVYFLLAVLGMGCSVLLAVLVMTFSHSR
jgi:cbb3-type cytochrome oxidase maturation protein